MAVAGVVPVLSGRRTDMLEFANWLQFTPFSVGLQSQTWITPLLQGVHILMIGVVFGSILMIALRVLGRAGRDQPFAAVWRRFAQWMWTALVVMTITGALLIVGEPVREFTSISFWTKLVLIAVGLVSVLSFRRALHAAVTSDAHSFEFSGRDRAVAMVTLLVWLLVIFFGRAIAYDAEVWGRVGAVVSAAVPVV